MSNKKLFYCFIASLFLGIFVFVLSVNIVSAATECDAEYKTIQNYGIFENFKNCRDCGNCDLNDFAQIAIAISNLILGLVGSLALLFFIYGGIMFLISSGSQERVTQAKQIIVGAVIGIVIVFTSYMIINFVAGALGIKGGILQSDWFKPETQQETKK
jgi:hypothetical protein